MIRLGLVNLETWDFLQSLWPHLSARFEASVFTRRASRSVVFRERLDRRRFGLDLERFMNSHDVVFFEWASEALARASWLPKTCAIVTRLHRYELYSWADRINWDAVDRVILVSEAKRREFTRRFPAYASKTRVVPEGVSFARFGLQPKPFSGALGTLCHVTPRKRVYDLVLAFADILETLPFLHLYIAGDADPAHNDYHEALRQLVDRLNVRSHVTFEGAVAKPWEWYPKIDVFISHSYSEGLQVAPMEAMASGCYTLSHAWDGAEELLPPEHVYLNTRELAEKIIAFCRCPDAQKETERKRMRSWAIDRFDADRLNERFALIVEESAKNRSS